MYRKMSKYEMLKQITALSFTLFDLHLYLNTHPMDRAALSMYNSILPQAMMLQNEYEKMYGPLSAAVCSPLPWQWINEPWPWEYEANNKLV